MSLPETVLQFGAGNFLRAFADLFIHQANERGTGVGRVVVVQSTGDGRANLLNERGGRYHVAVRGLHHGEVIDRVEECGSISRALFATTQWDDVIKLARSADLEYILSNTTEAGYALDPADAQGDRPPKSFPAKLLAVLSTRWRDGQPPVTIMPCELREDNADQLRALVLSLAQKWRLPAGFLAWATDECTWLSSLVDRIVPGRPAEHPLLESDPLLLMAEPYSLWALQVKPGAPPWFDHPAILRTADVKPFFLRKVRILNGAHTALVCQVGLDRFTTVLDAMNDAPTAAWLEQLLDEEIVPVLEGRCDDPAGFAKLTLERFRNPYLRHKLADIALHHGAKKAIRLETTVADYREKLGKEPPLLSAALKNDRVPAK